MQPVFVPLIINSELSHVTGVFCSLRDAVKALFVALVKESFLDPEKDVTNEQFILQLERETNLWEESQISEVCKKYNGTFNFTWTVKIEHHVLKDATCFEGQ